MTSKLTRRNLLKTAIIASLAAYQTGCSSNKPPLKISAHLWPGYELLFMGKDMGMINPEYIQLIPTESASSSMQAIRDKKVHGAMLTLDEVIRLTSEGIHLKIILVFNISLGADALLTRPEITSLAELKGKTIGYEESALGALMLAAVLEKAQLTKKDVKLRNLAVDQQERAWKENKVDALITFESLKTRIQKLQNSNKLFDSKDIPNSIFDVLVVTEEAAKLYPKELTELLRIQFNSLHHFRTNSMDASYRIAKRLNVSTEEILDYFYGLFIPDALTNFAYLSASDPRIINASERLKEIMKKNNIIQHDCQFFCSLTNEFIPREFL